VIAEPDPTARSARALARPGRAVLWFLAAVSFGCGARGPAPAAASAPPDSPGKAHGPLAPALAAALPLLEAAAPGGCRPRPAGLPPTLRIDAACGVQVTVVTRDPGRVAARIVAAGGRVSRQEETALQAWVAPALLRALASDPDVEAVRLPAYARPLSGAGPR
jgi:hypothetical protein